MSKSQDSGDFAFPTEEQTLISIAEDVLHTGMEEIYEKNAHIVTSWMNIQLSKEDSSLEKVGLMLARNFLIAHSANELSRAGKHLWEKKKAEALGDAA